MEKIALYYAICLLMGDIILIKPDNAPSCQFATFWINCYYINSESAQLVKDYLSLASQLFRHYSLAFYYSNVTTLPDDLLEGYVLDEILFQENKDVFKIPSVLSNVNANLSGLSFSSEQLASLSKQDLDLPFSEDLQHLYFINCPIQNIEGGSFNNFSSLKELWLEGIELSILEADTLNKISSLHSLVFYNSTLSAIEVDAFEEINGLQILELDYNQLSFLDQGSFDGLSLTTRVFLYDNPFNCTCELQWLKEWLNESSQLESSGATCSYPASAPFSEVNFCPNNGKTIFSHKVLP